MWNLLTTALDHVKSGCRSRDSSLQFSDTTVPENRHLPKHINALVDTDVKACLWVDGMDVLDEENTIPVRKTAGMVFQNPDNQIIASVVEEDVGFGPENIGVPTDEIWERVNHSLEARGHDKIPHIIRRINFPVGKSSVSQSPEFWPWNRSVLYLMSRPPCLIRTDEKKSLRRRMHLNREKGVTIHSDHSLYGRSGRRGLCLCHGKRKNRYGRYTARNFFTGGRAERTPPGRTAGNTCCR